LLDLIPSGLREVKKNENTPDNTSKQNGECKSDQQVQELLRHQALLSISIIFSHPSLSP